MADIAPIGSVETVSLEGAPKRAFAHFHQQIVRDRGGIPVLIAMLEDVSSIRDQGFDLFHVFSHQATEAFHGLCEKKNNEDPMDEDLYVRELEEDCVTFFVDDSEKALQKKEYAEDIMLGFVLWVRDVFQDRLQKLCVSRQGFNQCKLQPSMDGADSLRTDYMDEKDKMACFLLISSNLAVVFSKFFNKENAIRFKFAAPTILGLASEETLTLNFEDWLARLKELSIILPRFNAEALRNDQAFAELLVENSEKQLFFARPELDVNASMLLSQDSFNKGCSSNMENLQLWISELSRAFELSNGITALMGVDMLNELWVKGMGRTKSDLKTFIASDFMGNPLAWVANGFSRLFGGAAVSSASAAEAAPAVAATPVPAAPAPDAAAPAAVSAPAAAAAATLAGTHTAAAPAPAAAALVVHQPGRASEALKAATVDYAAHAAAVAQAAQNGGNNASPAGRFGCCPCLPRCC